MPINLEHYRQLLLAKEKQLVDDLTQAKTDAKESATPDVQDEMDLAVRTEEAEDLLTHGARDSDVLEEVRAALKRIDDGSYGKCQVCGRPINEKRLEAVPWAALDVEHQAEVDGELARPKGGSTL